MEVIIILAKYLTERLKNIYHANVNVNLPVKSVIQIKFGIMINVDVRAKIQEKMCVKKVTFGLLLHVIVKMVDIEQPLYC